MSAATRSLDTGISRRTFATDVDSTVYTADPSGWQLSEQYEFYPDYHDESYSMVDGEKNIIIASGQINLTQETNSQYIPFEMQRYYDGFDLCNTTLLFHFVNKNKYEGYCNPINVYTNDSKIRFAWLIDERVTSVEGRVSFEVLATGVNSKGNDYVWRTKPSDGINIIRSLAGNGVSPPTTSMLYYKKNEADSIFATKSEMDNADDLLTDKIADLEEVVSDLSNNPGAVFTVESGDDGDYTLVLP